jgi:hypothetical protein
MSPPKMKPKDEARVYVSGKFDEEILASCMYMNIPHSTLPFEIFLISILILTIVVGIRDWWCGREIKSGECDNICPLSVSTFKTRASSMGIVNNVKCSAPALRGGYVRYLYTGGDRPIH